MRRWRSRREIALDHETRVLIVGGGIAGLALANSLTQHGFKPVIVEIARTLQPHGLGLAITPNGLLALRRLGLADRTIAASVVLRQRVVADANGQVRLTTDYTGFREPVVGIYRNALLDVLTRDLDCDIRLGGTLSKLRDNGQTVVVEFKDGSTEEFNVVVGADGLDSSVRAIAFEGPRPAYRGYRAWRTVIPREVEDEKDFVVRSKPGVLIGTFPVAKELQYVFGLEQGDDDADANTEHWRHVRRLTSYFDIGASRLGERVKVTTPVIYTPVYEVLRDNWVRGHVVLVGDAAHAMVPMNAQGAAMALEDAVVLGQALSTEPDVGQALRAYEQTRIPRVKTVHDCVEFNSLRSGLHGDIPSDEIQSHPGRSLDILELMNEEAS